MSGIAVNVCSKNERIPSGAYNGRPSGTMLSIAPGAQHATIASRSRAATASKYARATLPEPGLLGFCADALVAAPAVPSPLVLSGASDTGLLLRVGTAIRPRRGGA